MKLKGLIFVSVQMLVLVLMTSRLIHLCYYLNFFNQIQFINYLGWIFIFSGAIFAIYSAAFMGNLLTPFPVPKKEHQLIINGPFSIVRHPIYFGLLMFAIGALFVSTDSLVALLGLILFITLYFKTKYEEELLMNLYGEYVEYQKTVKRLIPFIL